MNGIVIRCLLAFWLAQTGGQEFLGLSQLPGQPEFLQPGTLQRRVSSFSPISLTHGRDECHSFLSPGASFKVLTRILPSHLLCTEADLWGAHGAHGAHIQCHRWGPVIDPRLPSGGAGQKQEVSGLVLLSRDVEGCWQWWGYSPGIQDDSYHNAVFGLSSECSALVKVHQT